MSRFDMRNVYLNSYLKLDKDFFLFAEQSQNNSYVSSNGPRLSFLNISKLYIRVQFRIEYRPTIIVCNSIISCKYRLNTSRTRVRVNVVAEINELKLDISVYLAHCSYAENYSGYLECKSLITININDNCNLKFNCN